jgi:hypothetical protein
MDQRVIAKTPAIFQERMVRLLQQTDILVVDLVSDA